MHESARINAHECQLIKEIIVTYLIAFTPGKLKKRFLAVGIVTFASLLQVSAWFSLSAGVIASHLRSLTATVQRHIPRDTHVSCSVIEFKNINFKNLARFFFGCGARI